MNARYRACFLSLELCVTVMARMMLARALERNREALIPVNRVRETPSTFWASGLAVHAAPTWSAARPINTAMIKRSNSMAAAAIDVDAAQRCKLMR
jgi:hypothetical protein